MKQSLCRNCGLPTKGVFCSNCGQKSDIAQLKWSVLAHDFISTFVGDGAMGEKRNNIHYGLLLTLWSIATRPGATVSEYLEGRRRKYFNPVTILLLLSGFYALLASAVGYIAPKTNLQGTASTKYLTLFVDYCNSHPAMWYLILLPFTALAYKWVFRKSLSLQYVEYIYTGIFVAIFCVSLLFLKMGVEMLPWADTLNRSTQLILLGAQCWFSVSIYRALFAVNVKRAVWSWIKVMVISYIICVLSIVLVASLVLGAYYLIDQQGFLEVFSKTTE